MNDFDYDVMQKKRIARGAFSRKGTVNQKGCRLPHENLTKKEREALNGEVKTVGFNDKITWDFFKTLPVDLQEEYLDHQVKRFGVGMSRISVDLFGLTPQALRNHIARHGLNVMGPGKGKMPKAAWKSWNRWINSGATNAPIDDDPFEEIEPTRPEEHPTDPEVKPFRAHDFEDMFRECGMEREVTPTLPKEEEDSENVNFYPLTDLSLTLKGTPVDILTTLRMSFPALLDKVKTYRFTIKVDGYVL